MKYKELATLYHMDSSSNRKRANESEARRRLEEDSSFKLGYTTAQGDLFIAVPRELSMLSEQVLHTEQQVSARINAMPEIASSAMLRGMILDEVVATNLIEGVHSTRRQIKEALDSMDSTSGARKRFKELATLYMAIIDQTASLPESPEDIRLIYNKVMDGELSEKDILDGRLFRAQCVDVVTGAKVLHSGLVPEEKIIEALQSMMNIVSSKDTPALYSAVASHYIFEYAHPFYDGNGRTGRYLLALYLSRPLSMATSLSLSRTIAENKEIYYKAFNSVQNPLNHGELTHFVYTMLTLISLAQSGLLERLDASENSIKIIDSIMPSITAQFGLGEKEQDVIYLLLQSEVFGLLGDVSLSQISDHLEIGNQMARRYMSALEGRGIVKKTRGRNPISFALTDSFKDEFGIRIIDDGRLEEQTGAREKHCVPSGAPRCEPNEESLDAIHEADEFFALKGKGRFENAQEMIAHLDD